MFLTPRSVDVDADPKTFESLSELYGRDKNHVFYWGRILDGIDAASFRIIDEDYTADKNHLYFNTSLVEDADPATFRIISGKLAEDKNDFFWANTALKVADKATFVLIPDSKDSTQCYWAKDKYKAYNLPWAVSVPISDYESFRPLSHSYAIDDNLVYHRGDTVYGADTKSFREVAWDVGQDKNGVYYKSEKTDVADYSTLEYNYEGAYYQGNGAVYTNELKRINADIKTFRSIGKNDIEDNYWYADKAHVWYGNILVKGADPNSFYLVGSYHITDGERFENRPDGDYAADSRHVFYHDSLLVGADLATFEIIRFDNMQKPIVFDKSHIYSGKSNQSFQKYLKKKYH